MVVLGATVGEGEGRCCAAGSVAVFAVELAVPKMLMPQRLRKIRTSAVLLVAFLIRD
jgi:hypothetical protein